jgi:hypothetical protein
MVKPSQVLQLLALVPEPGRFIDGIALGEKLLTVKGRGSFEIVLESADTIRIHNEWQRSGFAQLFTCKEPGPGTRGLPRVSSPEHGLAQIIPRVSVRL